MGMNFLKRIFSIDTTSTNRTIIYIFGFKIRHIKSEVLGAKDKYVKLDCPVSEIPKATGVLRKIQLADLKLMEIFDKLCSENKLQYWIDFGNLLGAVRHGGFIPWDDDVDLGMMRDDYEKFIELFKNGVPDYPDLFLEFNNNGKNKCFAKFLHKKLPNIQIDIFPYDYYFKKTDDAGKAEITKTLKSLMNNWFYKAIFLLLVARPNSMRRRFKRFTEKIILKGNHIDKTQEPTIFCGIDYPHPHKQLAFDYETIFPLKKIKYEDKEFWAPNNTDKMLTDEFGNYMELPDDCYPKHAADNDLPKEINEAINQFLGLGV